MEKKSNSEKIPLMDFKHYLKICRGSSSIPFKAPKPSNLSLLEKKFSKYSQVELIATLSGLQLDPENFSQILRLGFAVKVACQEISKGEQNIERKQLKKLLN